MTQRCDSQATLRSRCVRCLLVTVVLLAVAPTAWAFPTTASLAIDPALGMTESEARQWCRALSKRLRPGQGPYRFGVLSELTCLLGQAVPPTQAPQAGAWLISVHKNKADINISVALLMGKAKIEKSSLSIGPTPPQSELVGALSEEGNLWLVALGILDQLPVLAQWQEGFPKNGETFGLPPDETASRLAIKPQANLVPVTAQFEAKTKLWNLNAIANPNESTAAGRDTVWMSNIEGRGTNRKAIESALRSNISIYLAARKAKKDAEDAAVRHRQEEELAEAKRGPRLRQSEDAWWLKTSLVTEPSASGSSYSAGLSAGWYRSYLRWMHIGALHSSTPFKVRYTSDGPEDGSPEAPAESQPEGGTVKLVFDELAIRWGGHTRFDLTNRLWATCFLDLEWRYQSIDLSEAKPEGFDFQRLSEKNVLGAGVRPSLHYIAGNWVLGAHSSAATLVPYADQYLSLQYAFSGEYLVMGRPDAAPDTVATPSSGDSAAESKDGNQKSAEPVRSAPQWRIGPLLQLTNISLNRTFPARDAGKEGATFTKVDLTLFAMGVLTNVSF